MVFFVVVCHFVLFSAWSNLVGEAEAGESKTSGLLPSVVSSVLDLRTLEVGERF